MTTILLADDDPMQHELVQATLGRAHRVLHAWDGREALEIARREHPDLVLLDVTMPVIDGFEACRQLKADAATREIIVVMLSARSEVSDRQRGLAVGADQYVTKPFRPSALLDMVGREPDGDHARQPRTAPAADVEPPADQPAEVAQTLAYARDVSALYEAAQERAERFRLLVEVGKDLMAARGLDALLRLALERAATFSGCEGASVLLLLRPEGPLEVRVSVGADPAEPGTRVDDLSRSVAGQALRTRRPLVIEGEAGDLGIGWGAPTKPIASAICLPLVTPGGQPIGVLALKNTAASLEIDAHDLDALQLLAAQVAAAVESARLHERLQGTVNALLAIHEASQVLSSSLETDEIGQRLVDIARRISGFQAAGIRLGFEGEPTRGWHTIDQEELWRSAQRTAAAQAARRTARAKGQPQFFHLGQPSEELPPLVGWCVPLRVQDRVVGVLEAYGSEAVASEATVETLVSLAHQAASALDNARLYRELAEREQRLEDLVGRLLVAQEEERRRVAYDVHDGVAQMAAGVHQHLQAYAHDPQAASAPEQLERAVDLARRTVREARRVIADLRPTALDDFGLAAALRLQVESLRADGWQITYEEALGDQRLAPAVETALFRVAQEALTNVRKHAGTTRAHVALQRQGRTIRLEVRDWGRGFRPAEVRTGVGPGERVGLPGMQERVALLGGRFSIRARPGGGTSVVATLALPAPQDGKADHDE